MKGVQQGILLKRFNYSETSLILHFYTLEDGFSAYIFQGGKKKKGNLLQALSIVEISSYKRKDSDLGKITEVNLAYTPQSLPFNPIKSSIAFFIAEVLSSVFYNSDQDTKVYNFLVHEIKWIDNSDTLTNYPIWFMLKLAEKIGIGIQVEHPKGQIFDLQEGKISNTPPVDHYFVKNETIPILIELLTSEKTELLSFQIKKSYRRQILDSLIDYYRIHINNFKKPKTIDVLQAIT